jgi:16S rRNA (guanine527-N7)-methyltransferase
MRRPVRQQAPASELQDRVRAAAGRYALGSPAIDALTVFVERVQGAEAARVKPKWRKRAVERLEKSLEALEFKQVRAASEMADIGSGLGFPGLVLAAALPGTHVTLIEQNPVLCECLRNIVDAMGLTTVEVVHRWVQRWPEGAGRFDLVTSRGVKEVGVMAGFAAPLLKVGGTLVLWRTKGKHHRNPEADSDPAALAAGFVPAGLTGTPGMRTFAYTKVASSRPQEQPFRPSLRVSRPETAASATSKGDC